MIRNKLLSNIFFGSELDKLGNGTKSTIEILRAADHAFASLTENDWARVGTIVKGFFTKTLRGAFGGPITAGDAFFIAAYMAAMRPKSMIEVGVCSGVSSAFILYAAHKMGLVSDGKVFLHSVDLLKLHGEEKYEVGRVVRMNYPSLLQYWKLNVEVTAPEIALKRLDLSREIEASEPTLAFIDANHMHPWPITDVLSVAYMLPRNSWVLLQDIQLMERWLANCVERGVVSPKPCRGVNLVTSLWSGSKAIGWDMCYNMGAVKLDAVDEMLSTFVNSAMSYPSEAGKSQGEVCQDYIASLTKMTKSAA